MKEIYNLVLLFLVLVHLSTSQIIEISNQKDLKKFLRTHTNVLIFYQETSRSGRDWLPLLNEAAEQIDGKGSIVHIDCSSAKKLCKRMKASPAPTLLKHYKDGKFHKDYDRIKSSKSISRFLEDPTSDIPWDEDKTAHAVTHLESEKGLLRLVTRESKPILLMFYAPWCGYCKRLKPEFASAAQELRQEAVLAGMDVDKPDLMTIRSQFNITGFPTIYYIHRGRVLYKYGGENNKEGIVTWMRNPQPPKLPEEEKKWSDEDDAVDIHFLVTENFDSFLKQNPSVLVMFYAPWCGHCKAMKPAYGEAATKLKRKGIVGALAAVDATKESAIAERFKVQGFPTVKYFKDGEFAFDFHERTAEKLVEFMRDPKEPPPPPPPETAWSEQPSEVHHLSADNYYSFLRKKKHVLVMLYAPWCGHCKKAKPEFTQAAEVMKDNRKVSFAALDCTQHSDLCTKEGVEGFPTFIYYSFGKKNPKGYTLGREEEDFVAFMTDPENPKAPGQKKHWKTVEGYQDLRFLDSTNFDASLQEVDALFVKFYAPWCGHCKAMKPAFAQLAGLVRNTAPRVSVGTVDATEDEALATRFGVTGYPTLLYITPDGNHEKYRGARTVEDMLSYIQDKHLKKESETTKGASDQRAKKDEHQHIDKRAHGDAVPPSAGKSDSSGASDSVEKSKSAEKDHAHDKKAKKRPPTQKAGAKSEEIVHAREDKSRERPSGSEKKRREEMKVNGSEDKKPKERSEKKKEKPPQKKREKEAVHPAGQKHQRTKPVDEKSKRKKEEL